MHQQLLEDSRKSSRRKLMTKATRKTEEARACLKLNKLMKDV
jgi:hypothetical protein